MEHPRTEELVATLAHHDAEIRTMGGRLTGVEANLHNLQGEVHNGFQVLGGKLDRMDAVPRFNFGQTVETVLHIAVIFSMVVGGIVWVTTGQFSGVVAEQKAINARVEEQMTKRDEQLQRITDKLIDTVDTVAEIKHRDQWQVKVTKGK